MSWCFNPLKGDIRGELNKSARTERPNQTLYHPLLSCASLHLASPYIALVLKRSLFHQFAVHFPSHMGSVTVFQRGLAVIRSLIACSSRHIFVPCGQLNDDANGASMNDSYLPGWWLLLCRYDIQFEYVSRLQIKYPI